MQWVWAKNTGTNARMATYTVLANVECQKLEANAHIAVPKLEILKVKKLLLSAENRLVTRLLDYIANSSHSKGSQH